MIHELADKCLGCGLLAKPVENAMSRWLFKVHSKIWQIIQIGGQLPVQVDND